MTQHIKKELEQRNYNHNNKNDNRDVCVCVGAQYLKHEFDLYFMWKRTVFGKEDTKIELEAFLCKGKRCRLTDYFKGVSFDETSILYI